MTGSWAHRSAATVVAVRAKWDAGQHAVMLRWSSTRKRYERQGLLVESEALGRAEEQLGR